MRGLAWILPLSAVICLSGGCGDSDQAARQTTVPDAGTSARAAAPVPAAAAAAAADPAAGRPDQVVTRFYQALRDGDNAAIEALLTDRAREETAKSGLAIQSQASGSLRYEIGETDYVTDALDGAHVASLWAEPDPDGSLISTEVIWVLRKQLDGWKISGMATAVAEGQLPLLFNFENPADMMQKKSYVESQLGDAQGDPAVGDSAASLPQVGNAEPVGDTLGQRQAAVTELRADASVPSLR
jgi:hypothetical protein